MAVDQNTLNKLQQYRAQRQANQPTQTTTITSSLGGGLSGAGQAVFLFTYPPPVPEIRWPNQLCEILAEAGRLLLEENSKLKERVAALEAKLTERA